MNNFDGLNKTRDTWATLSGRRPFVLMLALVILSTVAGRMASAQVVESATAGGVSVSVGGGVSGYYIQYGGLKSIGFTGYVDADSTRRFGIETEGRWLPYHTTADVRAVTYLAGMRYHFNMGRWQPYAKGLCGLGKFTFPYDYADGNYFVIAPGGGVDYRLNDRWSLRVDGEYQYWPQFTFGAMSSGGFSVGARYRILGGNNGAEIH